VRTQRSDVGEDVVTS